MRKKHKRNGSFFLHGIMLSLDAESELAPPIDEVETLVKIAINDAGNNHACGISNICHTTDYTKD